MVWARWAPVSCPVPAQSDCSLSLPLDAMPGEGELISSPCPPSVFCDFVPAPCWLDGCDNVSAPGARSSICRSRVSKNLSWSGAAARSKGAAADIGSSSGRGGGAALASGAAPPSCAEELAAASMVSELSHWSTGTPDRRAASWAASTASGSISLRPCFMKAPAYSASAKTPAVACCARIWTPDRTADGVQGISTNYGKESVNEAPPATTFSHRRTISRPQGSCRHGRHSVRKTKIIRPALPFGTIV